MERIAVLTYSPVQFYEKFDFKPSALLFDKIYIHHAAVSSLLTGRNKYRDTATKEENEFIDNQCRELDFLFEKEILHEYKADYNNFDFETDEEKQFEAWMSESYKNLIIKSDIVHKEVTKNMKDWTEEDWKKVTAIDNEGSDIETRMNVIGLKKRGFQNVYPVLASSLSYRTSDTKQDVLNFVLSQIPIPKENSPWEEIIDFRNDPDSKLKYYALINWVNSVASSNRPLIEIQDEYEYLYHQYARHFELHKMKTNLTTWEMIVAGGLEVLATTQGIPTFFKNLFSISKTRVELLQDELRLPGQEIAYIHKANQTFGRTS